jgi:hypothetical protein
MREWTQVAPETAPELVAAFQRLAKIGPATLTSGGWLYDFEKPGELTCCIVSRPNNAIECKLGHLGLDLPTPIRPLGHKPRRGEDCVAFFNVEGNKICIFYLNAANKPAWRHFEFG